MKFILSRPEVEGDVLTPFTEETLVAAMSYHLVPVYNDLRGIRQALTNSSSVRELSSSEWNKMAARKAAWNVQIPHITIAGETLKATVLESEDKSPWTCSVDLVSNVPRIHAEFWVNGSDYMCLRVSHRQSTQDLRSLSEIEGKEHDSIGEPCRFSDEVLKRLTARKGFPTMPAVVGQSFADRLEAVQNAVCPVIQDRLKAMTIEANGPFSGCAAFFEDISSHNIDNNVPQSLSVATIRASKLDRQPGQPFDWVGYPPRDMVLWD